MKVYIGPYRKTSLRSKVLESYMNKKHGFVWPDPELWTGFELFLSTLEDCINWFYDNTINPILALRNKLNDRKIKVRIDDYDTWSMDYTLAVIILPMLKRLKESKNGAPLVDDKDVPKELRSTSAKVKSKKYDVDSNHFKRWDWVLDEMIYSFECACDDNWEEQFYSGKVDTSFVKTEDGKYYRLKEGPNHTFKVDHKGKAKAWKRRINGLMLFGKYYHSLWD